jgi:hypothetical protein
MLLAARLASSAALAFTFVPSSATNPSRIAASLYTILQILSLTLFEKTPLDQLLNDIALQNLDSVDSNQLNLFS